MAARAQSPVVVNRMRMSDFPLFAVSTPAASMHVRVRTRDCVAATNFADLRSGKTAGAAPSYPPECAFKTAGNLKAR